MKQLRENISDSERKILEETNQADTLRRRIHSKSGPRERRRWEELWAPVDVGSGNALCARAGLFRRRSTSAAIQALFRIAFFTC